jgi:hypothetical protein
MKRISLVLTCALLVLSITSCQKDVSQDTPAQTLSDTLPVRASLTEKINATGQTQNVIADYTFSNGKLTKFAANWGDTLSNFTYNDKGYLTGYLDKASYGGALFQTDTYKISYNANDVTVEDAWLDVTNGDNDVTTTVYTMKDSLIVGALMDLGGHKDTVVYTYNAQGNVVKEEHTYKKEVRTFVYDVTYKNPFLIKGNLIFSAITGGDGSVISVNMPSSETDVYIDDNNVQQTINFKLTVNEHVGSYPTKIHSEGGPTTDDYVFTYNF